MALLALLAARGEPPLALGAVELLTRRTELAEQLDAGAASLLVAALLRTDGGDELPAQVLDLAARQRPPALRAPLEELAARDELAPPVVFAALATLHDAEPSVRGSAARALGSLGARAVPGLRGVVDSGDPDAARAALVALHLTGAPEAKLAREEIAGSHQDEGIRALAEIALGREVGHRH